MATTGLAEKQFASGLGDFLSGFGAKTRTSSSTTANTAPLEAIIAKAGQPMDMAMYNALIAGIMSTAAQQVPELSSALANAMGARTSNNSPLALAIAKLQADAANASASKVLDFNQNQTQIAANAAGNLANVTRSSNQTQTTKPPVNPLTTMLLGTVANQIDKRGGFDRLFGRGGNVAGSAASGASAYTVPTYEQMAPQVQQFQTDFAQYDTTPMVGPNTEFVGPMPLGDFGSFGVGSDAGFADFAVGDIGSFIPDTTGSDVLGGILGNDFTSGLDIGGADLSWSPEEWWFADGGVVRNRNQMGGPIQRQGMGAITVPAGANLTSPTAGAGSTGLTSNQLLGMIIRAAQQAQQAPQSASGSDSPGRSASEEASLGRALETDAARGYTGRDAALTTFGQMGLGLLAPALSPALAQAAPVTNAVGLTRGPMSGIMALVRQAMAEEAATASNGLISPAGTMAVVDPTTGALSTQAGRTDVLGNTTANMSLAPAGFLSPTANDLFGGLAGNPSADQFGPTAADMSPGVPEGLIGFEAAGGGWASTDTGSYGESTGLDAMGGYGTDFADGGRVMGPGNGTSDSIKVPNKTPGGKNIRISNGEFIFPADSVNAIGEDLLMRLLKATHTPVRR